MNTYNASAKSRGWALVLLAALSAVALPVSAQTCNATPKAKIDPVSQSVAESTGGVATVVGLSSNGSTPNNGTLLFAWAQTAGTTVALSGSTSATASFTAPNVGPTGATLTFRLTVTCGTKTDSITTNINITDVVVNNPPTAVATASPASAYEGNLVTLNGSASYDLDAGTVLTYQWTQIGGSPSVTLNNPTSAIATFVAPNTPITTGASLTFRLTVSDGSLTGSTDKIVNIVWTNDPPVASLVCPGGVFVVDEGDLVTLNGSGSSDSDGSIFSYAWDQVAGLPNLGIGALTTSSISFNAPSLGYNQLGSLTLRLTVTDNVGASSSTECGVFINDVTPPDISVPADITAEADSAAGTAVVYSVLAQDAVDDASPYALDCVPPSGSVFPLGSLPATQTSTTVACEATDSAGNTALAGFNVIVSDTTAPVITVPGSFAVEATGPSGAVANFSATTADAVDGAGVASCAPETGSTFALGTTPVTCNATDARGNAATAANFNLTVHDTTDPVVTPPADVTAEATGPQTVVAHGTATATDAVGVFSLTSDAPATFPVGATTITWTATDAAGNSGTATSLVTVEDTTPPVIASHGDEGPVEATGPGGANVAYTSPATSDLVDGPGTATCAPASGSLFALGDTTVTCNATDGAGNDATATMFDVTVVDTTPPAIDPHAAITDVEATGPGGAPVLYTSPDTHDLVDGDGSATCAPASGTTFALGTTVVSCNATDAAGNIATTTNFNVTVVDTTSPVIDAHEAVGPIEATGPTGASVAYTSPATFDIVDGAGTASCLPASGSTFALGITDVDCDASDNAGNDAVQTTFTVWVVDTTPPVIAAHGDEGPVEATGPGGANVAYTSPATSDLVDGPGTATCAPASGSLFALGDATVTCNATDTAGNAATPTSFVVRVRDTTAPVIAAHANVITEATGPTGAVVSYLSSATSDAVDGAGTASCAPASGSTFALGTTIVSCNATDAAGNVATTTNFNVTVVDTTPPTIASHADANATATSNSSAVVTYDLPTATDLVDGSVTVTCAPASGSTFNVGATTVTCSATDAAGNNATSTFKVNVSYSFTGFFRPIDNLPVINVVKAGNAIPVKFSLGGNQGLNIFATGSPASVATSCGAGQTDAVEETVTAGGSSLSYDAGANQYIYVWKTDKAWGGTCRQLQVKFRDGSIRWANFNFTR